MKEWSCSSECLLLKKEGLQEEEGVGGSSFSREKQKVLDLDPRVLLGF